MDISISSTADSRITTKQRILTCAVDLFASKGYTETSVRDIALAVGINASSLYNHFKSKDDILRFLLNDFDEHSENMFNHPDLYEILRKNPTAEGILTCLELSLSILSDAKYQKTLHVIFQEHHRNSIIRDYVAKLLMEAEDYVLKILTILKGFNVIRQDVELDFWQKVASSLIYTFPNRTMIGIGDELQGYSGMDLKSLLHYMFSLILQLHSVAKS